MPIERHYSIYTMILRCFLFRLTLRLILITNNATKWEAVDLVIRDNQATGEILVET